MVARKPAESEPESAAEAAEALEAALDADAAAEVAAESAAQAEAAADVAAEQADAAAEAAVAAMDDAAVAEEVAVAEGETLATAPEPAEAAEAAVPAPPAYTPPAAPEAPAVPAYDAPPPPPAAPAYAAPEPTAPAYDAPPPAAQGFDAPPPASVAAAADALPPLPDPTAPTASPQHVVYVPAPVPPTPRGNRGFGVGMALLGTLLYAVLFFGVIWVLRLAVLGSADLDFLLAADVYIPVVVFAVAFVLLALVVNRARWAAWVFGSLFVGAAVYFGTIGVDMAINAMLRVPGAPVFTDFLADGSFAIAALLGREVVVWWGAIVSARGAKVKARNADARAAFEAELAAGPNPPTA